MILKMYTPLTLFTIRRMTRALLNGRRCPEAWTDICCTTENRCKKFGGRFGECRRAKDCRTIQIEFRDVKK